MPAGYLPELDLGEFTAETEGVGALPLLTLDAQLPVWVGVGALVKLGLGDYPSHSLGVGVLADADFGEATSESLAALPLLDQAEYTAETQGIGVLPQIDEGDYEAAVFTGRPFIEYSRFPESIAAGSRFGPRYLTALARNRAGVEFSNQHWQVPLYEGDVVPGIKTQADLDDLIGFFHGVVGMAYGFRFKNWADYTATGSEGGFVQVSASTWQMVKTYTYGALSQTRKIEKPILPTLIFTGTGSYTLDSSTGIATVLSGDPPTAWTGEFDTPVRFDLDRMLPTAIAFEVFDMGQIPIVEIRT